MWGFLVHCWPRRGVPAELGSFQLHDIFHALKNLGLYREERQIKKGSFGFQISPPKKKSKLQFISLSPTGDNSTASCTKSSYLPSHISIVSISSSTEVSQNKASFFPAWKENLGGPPEMVQGFNEKCSADIYWAGV